MTERHETDDQAMTEAAPSAAATLFDLRTVIAGLFGSFGIVLLVIALTDTDQAQLDKAGGIHLDLWTALVMLVVSALFLVWVRAKPPLTPVPREDDGDGPPPGH